MRKRFSQKAQSTLEYAILIFVIIAALIAMQTYIKRGMQGKLRESTDQIGEQYSPGITTSDFTTTRDSQSDETVNAGVTSTEINLNTQNRTGWENVGTSNQEYWPQ